MKTKLLKKFRQNFKVVRHENGKHWVIVNLNTLVVHPDYIKSGYSYSDAVRVGIEALVGCSEYIDHLRKLRRRREIIRAKNLIAQTK